MPLKKVYEGVIMVALKIKDFFTGESHVASKIPIPHAVPITGESADLKGWRTRDVTEIPIELTINNGIIQWDVSQSNFAMVTLTSNAILLNPTNIKAGGAYVLIVKQDTVGNRTLSFGNAFRWPEGENGTPKTAPNSVTLYTFASDGVYLYGAIIKY